MMNATRRVVVVWLSLAWLTRGNQIIADLSTIALHDMQKKKKETTIHLQNELRML